MNPPPKVLAATQEYREEMDLLAEWMEVFCVISPERQATTGELYLCYSMWCDKNRVFPMNRKVFGRKIKSRGFTPDKINGQRGYRGIGVKREYDYFKEGGVA